MQNDMLNTLLHILINGPAVGSKEFEDLIDSAVSSWLAAKPRRKCPPKVFNTAPPPDPGSANEDVPVVIVHDVGVQATDDDTQLFYTWSCQIWMLKILIAALTLSFHKLQKVSVSNFIASKAEVKGPFPTLMQRGRLFLFKPPLLFK